MNAKVFIDTNVLVYAYDIDAGRKQQTAQHVLLNLWQQRTGALSMQVLQEFYVNVTRKLASPLSKEKARLILARYAALVRYYNPGGDQTGLSYRG
jgi:predicted nucleic acid-binding protein